MEMKTVYRLTVQTAKNYWQNSEAFDTFEALMATYGPWLSQQRSINVRFFQEKVWVQA